MTDLRLLTVEAIREALAGGLDTLVASPSHHFWVLRSVKAGGPDRKEAGGAGWLRLRFEATDAPVSQVILLDLSARTSDANIAPTALVDA